MVAGWLKLSSITSVDKMPPSFVAPGARVPRDHVFRVKVSSRILYLCASSHEEAEEWCRQLEAARVRTGLVGAGRVGVAMEAATTPQN